MTEQRMGFQAEVNRLLDIVANSLYSDREVFLRELISNASDACDKLRYESLTKTDLLGDDRDLKISLISNSKTNQLIIQDNGIGMDKEDLINNLGTIARSGTAAFMAEAAKSKDKSSVDLIGQFGMGFYSAFMVADKVDVLTLKAGDAQGWRWTSDGKGEFTISEEETATRGTKIILHLKEDAKEFSEETRLDYIVKKYSDHINLPISYKDETSDDDAKTLNAASAIWTRSKSDITEDQHAEFYQHLSHGFDRPAKTIHWRAEGMIEYTGLLYIPSARPFDLFMPERRHGAKLYVKRVFISDEAEGLIPAWLRFVRGVIDSEDLPLNVSREMLQNNPTLNKIRSSVTKRILSDIEKWAKSDVEEDQNSFKSFWDNFGAVLKEGLYEDIVYRDRLLKLARFHSSEHPNKLISLEEYLSEMKDGQESIFYITGEDAQNLINSPQLEGFKSKGINVLLLTDPVDNFWVSNVGEFEEKSFTSVTRSHNAELSKIGKKDTDTDTEATEDAPNETETKEFEALLGLMKTALDGKVKDVCLSDRLTNSPVCLSTDETGMDMHMARLMKSMKQAAPVSRILEINATHPLIRKYAERFETEGASAEMKDVAELLFDQALIIEGEPVADPQSFMQKMSTFLAKSL